MVEKFERPQEIKKIGNKEKKAKEIEKLLKEEKGEKEKLKKETKEATETIISEMLFQTLHEDLDSLKGLKWKEKNDKINHISKLFAKDAVIVYQDVTWGVEEIKDIKWFLEDVAKWEKTIWLSVSVEQAVKEWSITLEHSEKNWVDSVSIKRVDLWSDYLEN